MGGPADRHLGVVLALLAVFPSNARAQDRSLYDDEAIDTHERARELHARFVWARHDLERLEWQRRCLDHAANRAGALVRTIEDLAALGRLPHSAILDVETQLDDVEDYADEICTRTGEFEGDVEIEVSVDRDPFAQRMRRDRAIARVGARFEPMPRVRRAGYALIPWFIARGAVGIFVVPWLRVEATAAFSYVIGYGPTGSVGARAMVTAPWSLFRLAAGLELSVVLAGDRFANDEFGWLGFQIEAPVEIAWEITRDFGLTVSGGPMYTQPGEAVPSFRGLGYSVGLLGEIVL